MMESLRKFIIIAKNQADRANQGEQRYRCIIILKTPLLLDSFKACMEHLTPNFCIPSPVVVTPSMDDKSSNWTKSNMQTISQSINQSLKPDFECFITLIQPGDINV